MSLIIKERTCNKCNKSKDLKEFPCMGPNRTMSKSCHKCIYGQRLHFYEYATDSEKLVNLKKRLDIRVIKKKGCWDWNGFIRPDGYTRIKFNYKDIGGHVASWMVYNKQASVPKLHVLHICDNRRCTNPNHLFLGTYSDNMIDMVLKKRHPGIKLTVDQVKDIKKKLCDGVTLTRLAKDFEVHWATINDIKHGKTWKHVKM